MLLSPCKGGNGFIWINLNLLYPKMLCAKFGWNLRAVLKKIKIVQYIFAFLLLSPATKGGALYWNNLESPSPKDALCKVWLKLAMRFWRRMFQNSSINFCYFVIISPWEKGRALIWTNLHPIHQKMLCAKLGWNSQSSSGKDFKIFSVYFCNLLLFSFLKGWGSSFEQSWIPFT